PDIPHPFCPGVSPIIRKYRLPAPRRERFRHANLSAISRGTHMLMRYPEQNPVRMHVHLTVQGHAHGSNPAPTLTEGACDVNAYNGIPAAELGEVAWQKSRRSNSIGNCVEMARLSD